MTLELNYDASQDPDFIASLEAEQAESERIGGEIQASEEGLLAGKFQSAEELERGYIELQKLLGKKGAQPETEEETTDTDEKSEEPKEEEEEEDDFDAAAAVAAITEEYNTNGSLSPETIAELEKLSPLDVAALFLQAGVSAGEAEPVERALSKEEADAFVNMAGGEQQYAQMVEWGRANYAPAEVEAFNEVVASGNPNAIYFAISSLQSRYNEAVGTDGKPLTRTRPSSSRGDVFRSQAEVQRAMNDPRYDEDAAYRQDVFEKLERSNLNYD